MGITDLIDRVREKGRDRKELLRKMDEQMRVEKILEDRKKSANERELERFMKEDREESIKFELQRARKEREEDIKFNHNTLNIPNITKSKWEVMKEKNMFAGNKNKCMFAGQSFIHKGNPKMFKSRMRLIK